MRALLDEQLSPQIAVPLRQAGHDVDAVADREDLAGRSDRIILEVACSEGRAVVTNNIKDFRPLAAERLAQGRVHAGLIVPPQRGPAPATPSPPSLQRSKPYCATTRTAERE